MRGSLADQRRTGHWQTAHYSIANPFTGSITSVCYDAEGNRIIAGSDGGDLALIDIKSARTVWKIKAPANAAEAFVFDVSPDGMFFAAGRNPAPGAVDKGDLESKLAPHLEIRDMVNGVLVRTFRGYSRFLHFHRGENNVMQDEADFRKNRTNLEWYKKS